MVRDFGDVTKGIRVRKTRFMHSAGTSDHVEGEIREGDP